MGSKGRTDVRFFKEIEKRVDNNFRGMYNDIKEGRDIDATLMGYGFIFVDEYPTAKEYLIKRMKEAKA